jgi:hypothetical protein
MSITRQHRELKRWTTRTPPTYIHYKTTQRTKTVNNKNATKICPLQDNTENLKGEQQERHQHMSITRQHRELNRWTTRTPSTLLSNLLYLLTLLIDQNASAIQMYSSWQLSMEHFPLAICDFQTTFLKIRIKATEV